MGGIEPEHLLVLDTETTGLDPRRDEVLSLSIVDGEGRVLLDERFGATRHRRWDAAQAVHGIAPTDVKGLEPLRARRLDISQTLSAAQFLVGYNLTFDLAFLSSAGVDVPRGVPHLDVMREFARVHGLRSRAHPHGRWVSLADCARHYGLTFEPHSSLADAQATLLCFKQLCEETGLIF